MAEGGFRRSPTAHRTTPQMRRHGKKVEDGGAQTTKTIQTRGKNNAARKILTAKLGAKAVAGKDVGHKKRLSAGGTNAVGNLKVQSKKVNRGHGRTRGSKPNLGRRG